MPLGDLGHPHVDARLLMAVLLRGGEVADWLAGRGLGREAVQARFPGQARWPLQPPPSRPHPVPDPADRGAPIAVDLQDLRLGGLGTRDADARLVWALVVRPGRVGEWLRARGLDAAAIEAAFPGCAWS